MSQRFRHGTRYTANTVAMPYAVNAAPANANTLQAGACAMANHHPPTAITAKRTEPARTGQSILPAPCEAKKRHKPIP